MRFIEIDGEKREVCCCEDCPCYDGGFDGGFGDTCKHPRGDGSVAARGGSAWYDEDKHEHRFDGDVPEEYRYGYGCPLRTKPELAEGGVIDPSKAGGVYLDPPGSNEEREIVIPEWVHILLEKEILGCLIAFCMPRLMEDIAKLDPKEQAQIVKNLEEMRRFAWMKPEERPLCTMDQEEKIKRGIEACTVKRDKG